MKHPNPRTSMKAARTVFELEIDSLAHGGDAVGRLPDGRVAFVSGGCPGDRVLAELDEDHGRFVRGHVAEVLAPSPERVTPPCPYFGTCGGCFWQHVSVDAQRTAKRNAVIDTLTRIGRIADAELRVGATLSAGPAYGYRNKIELVADPSSERLSLGFHRAHSEQVVPVESCLLLAKQHRKAPRALSGALRFLTGEGDLGIVRVGYRAAAHTKDVEVALWTEPGPFPRQAVAKTLRQAVPATSVVRVLTKGPSKERRVAGVEALAGRGAWRERLGGIAYTISAPSFFQVNTLAAEQLVNLALDYAEVDGSDRVLDLYAGAGTFTLPLAERAGEVVAVESSGPAVRDLRRNLEERQTWAEVVGGDAAREIAELGHFDVIVVDPPRSGLAAEVTATLSRMRPRVLVYVACDPATLARDARVLAEGGYRLEAAAPVDLFPQTYHVETVARFVRSDQPSVPTSGKSVM